MMEGRRAAELRIQNELSDLALALPRNITFRQTDDANFMRFRITIDLNDESADCFWRGGYFWFTITIPNNYPHDAPVCHCDTPIYHPNISMKGKILLIGWTAACTLNSAIYMLYSLLKEPELK